ncbi:hypothetical protein [Burkholderia ubonensis]|uniref:hypothetical protein n=1 Tax=Burkholderia ubonensis TaxID=101571 RepID=UPI000A68F224|nr:hypothetical protein [Burkholderia ubonensis]
MTIASFLHRLRSAIFEQDIPSDDDSRDETITESAWLRRCAARFVRRGNVDQHIADSYAIAAFENAADFGFENDPEGAADCEMSYWSD